MRYPISSHARDADCAFLTRHGLQLAGYQPLKAAMEWETVSSNTLSHNDNESHPSKNRWDGGPLHWIIGSYAEASLSSCHLIKLANINITWIVYSFPPEVVVYYHFKTTKLSKIVYWFTFKAGSHACHLSPWSHGAALIQEYEPSLKNWWLLIWQKVRQ
jgi:hypothetical protein